MDNDGKPAIKVTPGDDAPREEQISSNENGGETVVCVAAAASAADEVGHAEEESQPQPPHHSSTRTPFTDLSQVEADWALARTLQEQERAYMMLRMNNEGSDYGSWEAGSYFNDDEEDFEDPDDESDVEDVTGDTHDGTDIDDEDAFDVHATDHSGDDNVPIVEFDPDAFSGDEAFARALQEAEEREMAARMLALAGINDQEVEESEDHHGNSQFELQDNWEDVDTDEFSYEELLALGEVVGTESRGLSADTIASLTSVSYKAGSSQHGPNDSCVICRVDYEEGETLTVLSCKHSYHLECINNWLKINKVCPVCSAEVSASPSS